MLSKNLKESILDIIDNLINDYLYKNFSTEEDHELVGNEFVISGSYYDEEAIFIATNYAKCELMDNLLDYIDLSVEKEKKILSISKNIETFINQNYK